MTGPGQYPSETRGLLAAAKHLSIDPAGEVGNVVIGVRGWLDRHDGYGAPELGLRVARVAEAAGTAVGAWLGLVGQHPRTGMTHTRDEVAAELGEVVLAALVALRSRGYDPAAVLRERAHARVVTDRVFHAETDQPKETSR